MGGCGGTRVSIEGPTRHTLCRSVCLVYVARRYPLVSGDRAWFIETRQTAVRAASCGSCSVRLLPRCGADNISTREVVALPARETDRGRLLFTKYHVWYTFSARCTTYVTGLDATGTYGAREMSCPCCWLYVAASHQTAKGVKQLG